MSFSDYSSSNGLLVLKTINITDWGETQPSLTIEDVKPLVQVKHGMGGGAAALEPVTRPKKVTINLLPGSAQARALVALAQSKVTIQGGWTQMGSAESETFIDGRITSRGPRNRIAEQASALSDEQFVIEFRDSTET